MPENLPNGAEHDKAGEANAEYDPEPLRDLKPWFRQHDSIEFGNFPVGEEYLMHGGVEVRCGR